MQKLIDDVGAGIVALTVIIVLYFVLTGGGSSSSSSPLQNSRSSQQSKPVPTTYEYQKPDREMKNKPDFYTDGTKDPDAR